MKKGIHQMELFPITKAGETYYITYGALRGWVEDGLAAVDERELYEAVRTIFEPTFSPTLYA